MKKTNLVQRKIFITEELARSIKIEAINNKQIQKDFIPLLLELGLKAYSKQ